MLVTSNGIDIEIDRKQVCRYAGCGTDYKPPARISSLIDEYVELVQHLTKPFYSYVIKNIERVEGSSVFIEDSIIFRGRRIARLLEQCCKVSVFVATIGRDLEEMVYRLAGDSFILQAVLLDAIGSDIAEKVADFVQGKIREIANARGLCISQRFSPGYCDWDIGQQKMVFRAVGRDSAGIRLTEKCLMIPQKSISGIIGIASPNSDVEDYNPCKTCDKHDCPGRRGV